MARALGGLLSLLPPSIGSEPRETDVSAERLEQLRRRLRGETVAFQFVGGSWSAASYTGEYSAHGDSLADVVDELVAQLPVCA